MVAHESFPLHARLFHDPPGRDISHVGGCPNTLKRKILEPKREEALERFTGITLSPIVWMHCITDIALPMSRFADADADSADQPGRFSDLDGKVPIILRVGLAVSNNPLDEFGRACDCLRR